MTNKLNRVKMKSNLDLFNVYVGTHDQIIVMQLHAKNHSDALDIINAKFPDIKNKNYTIDVRIKHVNTSNYVV
tara:strand:- start:273 stop:491 length:219 start_codon:yes stop_codon:yes gene_type:complete